MRRPQEIAMQVYAGLLPHAHPRRAREMAAYMRTTQPFLGVPNPLRQPVFRAMCADFGAATFQELHTSVERLWLAGERGKGLPQHPFQQPTGDPDLFKPRAGSTLLPPRSTGPREMQYAAIAYLEHHRHLRTVELLPLCRRMIAQGGWWDTVDWLSTKVLSGIVLEGGRNGQAGRMKKEMSKWLDDEQVWIRRAAILSQMQGKSETDAPWLFEMCLRRGSEREFFIAKAIGWALRQYARTDPVAVRAFLLANRDNLQPLSIREAGKHIGVSS